jgi:hypothetical protein
MHLVSTLYHVNCDTPISHKPSFHWIIDTHNQILRRKSLPLGLCRPVGGCIAFSMLYLNILATEWFLRMLLEPGFHFLGEEMKFASYREILVEILYGEKVS